MLKKMIESNVDADADAIHDVCLHEDNVLHILPKVLIDLKLDGTTAKRVIDLCDLRIKWWVKTKRCSLHVGVGVEGPLLIGKPTGACATIDGIAWTWTEICCRRWGYEAVEGN